MCSNFAVLNNIHTQKATKKANECRLLGISLTQRLIRNVTMATSAGGQQLGAACEGNRRNSAIMRNRSERRT